MMQKSFQVYEYPVAKWDEKQSICPEGYELRDYREFSGEAQMNDSIKYFREGYTLERYLPLKFGIAVTDNADLYLVVFTPKK